MITSKIQSLLTNNKLDAMLITDPYNRRYISGFTGSTGTLYLGKNRQVMLTDSRYVEQVKRECVDFVCLDVKGKPYIEHINQLMKEDQAECVGFEDESISLKEYLVYEKKGIQKELVGLGSQVDALRIVKEEWEIDRLREAERIGDEAFAHIVSILKPGITEVEIAIELEFCMRRQGASGLSFDSIVASGVNSSLPHAHPTNKKIENGDFVTMDFGCIYEGYCSDMTRTVVVGNASSQQKEIYQTVLTAQEAALAIAGPNRPCDEADKAARDVIVQAGYGDCFGHGLGHSVGLFIHESPRYSPSCHEIIRPNTSITVEPGIYVPGYGGVRIEDLIIIRETGYENLTHSPKHLIEL